MIVTRGFSCIPSSLFRVQTLPRLNPTCRTCRPAFVFQLGALQLVGEDQMPTSVCLLLHWPAARPLNSRGPCVSKSTWFVFLPPSLLFSYITCGFARYIPGNDEGTPGRD